MRFVFVALITVFFSGCEKKEAPKTRTIESCVMEAVSLEKTWEKTAERWLFSGTNDVFRQSVDSASLIELCDFREKEIALRYDCSVPLFVKVVENHSKKQESTVFLDDVRGNPDFRFEIEFVLWGRKASLLLNRLYFVLNRDGKTVVCSRRCDVIHARSKSYPSEEALYDGDMGVYSVFRGELVDVFLGDRNYNLKSFIQEVLSGKAKLYWDCGIRKGIHEGIHVYENERFEEWLAHAVDLIPLNVVFKSSNTVIFAPGEISTKEKRRRECNLLPGK